MSDDELTFASTGPAGVHYARCWNCQLNLRHHEPPEWHTWADDEDIDWAIAHGMPDPSESRCGCWCAEVKP